MQFHPGFSIINKVDSVLVSQKLPTKLFSDTNTLVQTKYGEGSMAVDGQCGDRSNNCFNNDDGLKIAYNHKDRPSSHFIQMINKSSNQNSINPSNTKSHQQMNSAFQVSIYTEDKDTFFNTKYHNNQTKMSNRLFNSSKQKVSRQNTINKAMNSSRDCFNLNNNGESYRKRKEKLHFNDRVKSSSRLKSLIHGKQFEWESDYRRLRRMETICYKTCSTCHRRFYKNEIQSNVLEVKITNDQMTKEIQTHQQQKPATLFFKNTPDFLNKKLNQKSSQGLINSPQSKHELPKMKSPQKYKQKQIANSERSLQFNWLSKRQKTINEIQTAMPSHDESSPLSPKQIREKVKNEELYRAQSPNKSLSIHDLFLLANKKQQQSQQKVIYTPKQTVKSKAKQNRKSSGDSLDVGLKPKYFTALKSAKQLFRTESKQKLVFNKLGGQHKDFISKIAKQEITKEKTMQNIKNQTMKDSNHPEKRTTFKKKTIESQSSIKVVQNKKEEMLNQCSKSIEKRLPRFIEKKQSLNTQLNPQ